SVCPGIPKLPKGSDDGADLEFSAESSDAVSALTVTAASDLAGNIPGITYYATKADPDKQPSATEITDALDEEMQQGPPATGVAAATAQHAATAGDLAGMATAADTPAAHEHWLPGATTTTGTTAVLTVTNPSSTHSTIPLDVFDQDGPVDSSGATGIVLAPGQTRSMLVAGLAPRQESVAVPVSSSG